ncbi:MAG: hypothetical protein NW206_06335 [Hyphomonadaceae bacterium]|nr:hypothetical protein [Hyphomonadaceae bacterium]
MGKITLGQAAARDTYLIVYCMNHAVQYGGCFHSAEMPMAEAIDRWGERTPLDRLPFVCTRCGSRNVDVRSDHPRGIGGSPK